MSSIQAELATKPLLESVKAANLTFFDFMLEEGE